MHEKTYEMMWDCEFCGTTKLLGLTHRFCAECGAPQNPAKRYFPPDHEKVAVQDHKYAGADVMCPSCQHAMSAAVKCCTNCGGPLQGGAQAARLGDQIVGPPTMPGQMPMGQPPMGQPPMGQPPMGQMPMVAPAPQKKGMPGWIWAVIGVVALAIVAVLVLRFVWKEKTGVEVTGHTWTRTIAIERFDTFRESGNCSSVPSGAKVTKRTKGQEKCQTRKIDNGDGTFKEKRECQTEPDRCDYEVQKWKEARTVKEQGDLDDEPRWPRVDLKRKGKCVGCEREGSRNETYTVLFKELGSGEKMSCNYSASEWKSYKVGSTWDAEKHGLGGDLVCDSLGKPK